MCEEAGLGPPPWLLEAEGGGRIGERRRGDRVILREGKAGKGTDEGCRVRGRLCLVGKGGGGEVIEEEGKGDEVV